MSAVSRLISGTAASWIRLGISMASQFATVPIFLSYWDSATFGIYLALQGIVTLFATLDNGYQTYVGYEFFRYGKGEGVKLGHYLGSVSVIGVSLGILQLCLMVGFVVSGMLALVLGATAGTHTELLKQAGGFLLLQGGVWLIFGTVGGLLVRVLSATGYYSRMAWWGVFSSLVTTISPAAAVAMGANLFQVGIATACASIAYNIPMFVDMVRMMRREGIRWSGVSLRTGWESFLKSLVLSLKNLLESMRVQGARVALAPLAGAADLTAFSTMRTGANVALQGLGTITNPLMPELMRFLRERDQGRSEAAFSMIWIVLIAAMAPAVMILQAIVAPLFLLWTRGQIPFDPKLFAVLSLGVLVYALAQPAMAVALGNNLLKPQLIISACLAAIVLGGMWLLVPRIGIFGAGLCLLLAEIVAAAGYRFVTRRWLRDNGLVWPEHQARLAARSIWLAAIAMGAMVIFPSWKWAILIVSLLLTAWNLWCYWQALPELATSRAKSLLLALPGARRVLRY